MFTIVATMKGLKKHQENDNLANVRFTDGLYRELAGQTFQLEDMFSSRKPIYGTIRRLHQIMDIRGLSNPDNHRYDRYMISAVE